MLLTVIGVIAGMWFVGSLAYALSPSRRRQALKHAAAAALIFIGSAVVSAEVDPVRLPPTSQAGAGGQTTAQALPGTETDYLVRIEDAAQSIAEFSASDFEGSVSRIAIALDIIDAWAKTADDGASLSLTSDAERKRQEFIRAIAIAQSQIFPVLRDAYGPAARRDLWEADGWARTFGPEFRTIEIVNAAFATNRTIKLAQETLQESLYRLRFTRAEYKWLRDASEFSYFDMSPPKDDEVVIWTGGQWHPAR